MKRKIVKHGPSTLIISLPSGWVRQNGIQKGDELDIKQEGRTLIIGADKTAPTISITQDISSIDRDIVKDYLARLYTKGYDRAYLIHNNTEILEKIQEKTLELIGYEIIEQNSTYCVIQSISSHIELDFDNSLRKSFLIAKQMLENCIEGYKNNDKILLESARMRNLEISRFCNFCLRQIHKGQYESMEHADQTYTLYHIIESVEKFGNIISALAAEFSRTKKSRDIEDLLILLREEFDVAYSYFYKPTIQKTNAFHKLSSDMEQKIKSMINSRILADNTMTIYMIRDASESIRQFISLRLDLIKQINAEINI